MSKVYAIANQKGGCGKTTLTLNLGACLARMGYRVCLCDCDPQANMTMALGYPQPEELPVTLPHIMQEIISVGFKPEKSPLLENREYILNAQGMDFVPSSIELTGIENILINTMSRENVLKKFISHINSVTDICCVYRLKADASPEISFPKKSSLTKRAVFSYDKPSKRPRKQKIRQKWVLEQVRGIGMSTVLVVIVCFMASIGVVQSLGWLAMSLRRCPEWGDIIQVVPLCSNTDELEAQLRHQLFMLRWSTGIRSRYVVLLDTGLDDEAREVCRNLTSGVNGMIVCTPSELSGLVSSLSGMLV